MRRQTTGYLTNLPQVRMQYILRPAPPAPAPPPPPPALSYIFLPTDAVTGFDGWFVNGVTDNGTRAYALDAQNTVWSSPDGLNWTSIGSTVSGALTALTYGNGLFVGAGGGGAVETSPNGVDWTPRTSNTAELLLCAGYANGTYVVAGENGAASASTDGGATWTTSAVGDTVFALAYGAGVWVAVGNGGIAWSDDALTWNNVVGANRFRCVAWSPTLNLFMAGGIIYPHTSPDGKNWTQGEGPETDFSGMAWGAGQFAACTLQGAVWANTEGDNNWTQVATDDAPSASEQFITYFSVANAFLVLESAPPT